MALEAGKKKRKPGVWKMETKRLDRVHGGECVRSTGSIEKEPEAILRQL